MNSAFAGPIGLIVNPRSQRNRERLGKLRAVYGSADDIVVREIANVGEIPSVLEEFERAGITLLALSGGDGTVQATMTSMLSGAPRHRDWPLAILAGGMTNVIGHHLGIKGKPDRGLAALLSKRAHRGQLTLLRHPVMAVRIGAQPAVYGMLLGGAGFRDGVMMARERVHPVGFAQAAAAGIGTGIYYFRTLLGGASVGHRMKLTIDSARGPDGNAYLLLVSCLPGLMLGFDPFWGEGTAPLRWTWVDHPPRRLAIAVGPLLFGSPLGWMTRRGYLSGRALRIEIESDTPLLLDGEHLEAGPGIPIVIDSGNELTFARL
jgi:diacylglycerol kinase (ATP)